MLQNWKKLFDEKGRLPPMNVFGWQQIACNALLCCIAIASLPSSQRCLDTPLAKIIPPLCIYYFEGLGSTAISWPSYQNKHCKLLLHLSAFRSLPHLPKPCSNHLSLILHPHALLHLGSPALAPTLSNPHLKPSKIRHHSASSTHYIPVRHLAHSHYFQIHQCLS